MKRKIKSLKFKGGGTDASKDVLKHSTSMYSGSPGDTGGRRW